MNKLVRVSIFTTRIRYCLLVIMATAIISCNSGGETDNEQPDSKNELTAIETESGNTDIWHFRDITESTNLHHQWGIINPSTSLIDSDPEQFSGGIAAGDYNNDGLVDLFIDSGDKSRSQLFVNLGNNQFEERALEAGVALNQHKGSGPTFADVNGDNWLDLFIGGIGGDQNYLFINNQDGTFTDFSQASGLIMQAKNTISASFADIDKDGDLDLAVSHWGNNVNSTAEHLWLNNGQGVFTNVSQARGVSDALIITDNRYGLFGDKDYTFTPSFADLNNDGWPDLTYVSDFKTTRYFFNDQKGHFVAQNDPAIIDENGMGSALGDFDNDGDLDWFVSAIYEAFNNGAVAQIGNRLYQNQQGTAFKDVSFRQRIEQGGWGWAACFADFNNDGYLDIFHTNGWHQVGNQADGNNWYEDANRLYISNQAQYFTDQALEKGIADTDQGRGVVCFDSDLDGDIDIITISNETDKNSFNFYENRKANQQGNYLNIRLEASTHESIANTRVYLTLGQMTQMRELTLASNFTSQNPAELHFGLAQAEKIDTLLIVWPNGAETKQKQLEVNQNLTFTYP